MKTFITTFAKLFLHTIQHSFHYKGRARRCEFWNFLIIAFLVLLVEIGAFSSFIAIFNIRNDDTVDTLQAVVLITAAALLVSFLAVAVRRLHDMGKSGGWIIAINLPFGIVVLLIWWLFYNSQPGHNEYGPNPKGIGNDVNGNPYQG